MKCHYCELESDDLVKDFNKNMVCRERSGCRVREANLPIDNSGHDLFCQEVWDGETIPCHCGQGRFPGEY